MSYHAKLMTLLFTHFALCAWAVYTHFNWWLVLLGVILGKLFGLVGHEIGLHRLWTHRSFKVERWKEYVLHALSVPVLFGSSLAYAGVHRQHHAHSDTDLDSHITRPWWKMFFYVRRPNFVIESSMVKDLIRDPVHRWVHKNYFRVNLTLLAACLIVLGPIYTGWTLSFSITYSFIIAGLTNVLGHRPEYGERRYDTKDQSSNNILLQFLTWNGGLHHNHHYRPNHYSFRHRPGDIDAAAWIIERFFMVKTS